MPRIVASREPNASDTSTRSTIALMSMAKK
jgi:hypothetical protein